MSSLRNYNNRRRRIERRKVKGVHSSISVKDWEVRARWAGAKARLGTPEPWAGIEKWNNPSHYYGID